MIINSHCHEWITGSEIDPTLTSLNLVSLSNYEPHEYLLYALGRSERRNDGRLSDKWLKKYAHLSDGGWWCSGVDVLTGEDSEWGCFKPDTPRITVEYNALGHFKKAKLIKYEHPPKADTEIFALKVPLHLWQAIANRYEVPLPKNIVVTPDGRALGFWAWMLENTKIPLIITEGAKKAGAIITANYVAIALPGIWGGYRQPKDEFGRKYGKPYLIPELELFAQKDREIIFCFDNDPKRETRENVQKAIIKTGGLFKKKGCKVSFISWNCSEKGVDDLIVAKGADFFHALYENRSDLSFLEIFKYIDLSKYEPLEIHERYLDDKVVAPSDAQLIALKSAKNTGKTEWMARQVLKALRQNRRVIIITHRQNLAIELAERFGIDYRTELLISDTKGALGYVLCIDSLHPHANPPFNPEEWREALVIIDEVEQVLWHMLESNTCKDNRLAIIRSFKYLLQTAVATGGKVMVADADLSAISLDYIRGLIGFPINTWVLENKYLPNQGKRKLIVYTGNDPRKILAGVRTSLEKGEKLLIHTTGQKAQSKWGTITLESHLKKLFPELKILRIDRESTKEPNHPAMGCMTHLNKILPKYDVVICSPVLETGVSINVKGHFDNVYVIAYGVQSVNGVCQTVDRARDDVTRHLWIKATAKDNRIGSGSTNLNNLLFREHRLTRNNLNLLRQADIDEFDELDFRSNNPSLYTWGKFAAVINDGKNDYRNNILKKLRDEGYELENYRHDDVTGCDEISTEVGETRDKNYDQQCLEVSESVGLSKEEYKQLQKKRTRTHSERIREKKTNLMNRYGIESVNSELIKKDDKGWYSKLTLHYYFTVGNIFLAYRDKRKIKKLTEHSQGTGFKPDINKAVLSAQIKALELLNFGQFFNPEGRFTKDNLSDWWSKIKQHRREIYLLFKVNINPTDDNPIGGANRLLGLMDAKLELIKTEGSRKDKQRVYSMSNSYLDDQLGCLGLRDRREIFSNWLARDEKLYHCDTVLTIC